ncbi:CTLH/CRA C-terminal to lish motif domain-containing protein, partial [Cristinia sonorae]
RTLVLDYLCHNSYTGTARAFVRESAVKHLDADGDELMSPAVPELSTGDPLAETLEERLAPAEVRREIQTHLLSGRMDEAISLLNEHFPSVLSEEREPLLGADKSQPSTGFDYIPVTSVDPTHLALNLRIHAFIEAARTVPLPYHPPTALPTTPLSPSSPALAAASKLSVKGPSDPAAHQYDLLHRAQSLYAEAQSLVSAEARATYLVELSHVSGLLAYTDPENSPVSVYLKQERREAIARQVESAILYRTNKLPVSKIELYTRYTSVLWRMCNEYEVKVPPVSRWPAGVKLP